MKYQNIFLAQISALTILICFIPLKTFAYSWPIFTPPNKELLLALNLIDVSQCPIGYGKLRANPSINISQYLCRTYCLNSWRWEGSSDDRCRSLETEFRFQHYTITHHQGEDGTTSYSEITAFYSNNGPDKTAFQFKFKSEPEQHWYCIREKQEGQQIICANDI